jgi:hypothetical protein
MAERIVIPPALSNTFHPLSILFFLPPYDPIPKMVFDGLFISAVH